MNHGLRRKVMTAAVSVSLTVAAFSSAAAAHGAELPGGASSEIGRAHV